MEAGETARRQEWDITTVAATPRPAFTTGLASALNHPELIVVEQPEAESVRRIEAAVAKIGRRHPALLPGKTYVATGGAFRVRAADPAALRGLHVTAAGNEATFLQLLWPDGHGRFPGEPGCDPVAEARQDISPWAAAPGGSA